MSPKRAAARRPGTPTIAAHAAEAIFVPGDPLRRSTIAFWHPSAMPEEPAWGGAADEGVGPWYVDNVGSYAHHLDIVTRAGSSVRTTRVPARIVPFAVCLDWLVELAPTDEVSPAVAAWAVAARIGTDLVARGRLVPGRSETDLDQWRIGVLDPTDELRLDALARALPPTAHAIAKAGRGPKRLEDPRRLVRAAVDAVADVFVRTEAANNAATHPAYSGLDPIDVGELGPWLDELDRGLGLGAGARPGIRLEIPFLHPPEDRDEFVAAAAEVADPFDDPFDDPHLDPVTATLQLRSKADPSLVIDARDLWDAPEAVLARMGEQAEIDLLLALRRGAEVWPPLERALHDARPDTLAVTDDEAFDLLGPLADELAAVGFEVLWPSGVLTSTIELKAVVHAPSPSADGPSGLDLNALVDFDWRASLGGIPLTEAELVALAEAKRPLVRLRGRWVTADPHLLDKLRSRGRLRASDALGAALSGSLVVDGEEVAVELEGGPLATLTERLHEFGGELAEAAEPPGLEATLRPYQRRGLAWLDAMSELGVGGCLADDMGLGKTLQLIALHVRRHQPGAVDPRPTLVVCPTTLLGNWEREVQRFAPATPVRRFHGGARTLDDLASDEIVLATYGVVRRDTETLAGIDWGLVVADEAQHAKNPLSRTARALRAVPAGARLALTGTPVENRLTELWAILDWTTPGLLGSLETFKRNVAVPIERHQDEHATERLSSVVRPFLLRRRKSDAAIAPELPPKTERDVIVPLTVEQATLYEAAVRESLVDIADAQGIARRGLVLRLLTSLKQITNHPAQYLHQEGPLESRSGKLEALDELLPVILAESESVLVFTQYVQMGRLLVQHLATQGIPVDYLHGRVPVAKREEMVDRFQRGDVPVLLLSLKAGGTGLNLTKATHVIHYDRWWNPAVEDQATDRAYRIGQDQPVQVHRLVTEGTIEDKIAQLLARKRDLADAIVGSGEHWIGDLDDTELADLVNLDRSVGTGVSRR